MKPRNGRFQNRFDPVSMQAIDDIGTDTCADGRFGHRIIGMIHKHRDGARLRLRRHAEVFQRIAIWVCQINQDQIRIVAGDSLGNIGIQPNHSDIGPAIFLKCVTNLKRFVGVGFYHQYIQALCHCKTYRDCVRVRLKKSKDCTDKSI